MWCAHQLHLGVQIDIIKFLWENKYLNFLYTKSVLVCPTFIYKNFPVKGQVSIISVKAKESDPIPAPGDDAVPAKSLVLTTNILT